MFAHLSAVTVRRTEVESEWNSSCAAAQLPAVAGFAPPPDPLNDVICPSGLEHRNHKSKTHSLEVFLT